MVTEWGMSEKVGPISYASEKEIFIGRDMASHVTYSEDTAAIIDEEVRLIVENSLIKARKILAENKQLLDNMARLLVERETIFAEEVDMLMEGKSVEEIIDFMDNNEHNLQENPFKRKGMPEEVKSEDDESKKISSKTAKRPSQTEKESSNEAENKNQSGNKE